MGNRIMIIGKGTVFLLPLGIGKHGLESTTRFGKAEKSTLVQ